MQTSDQIQRLSYQRFLAAVHYHSDRDETADGPRDFPAYVTGSNRAEWLPDPIYGWFCVKERFTGEWFECSCLGLTVPAFSAIVSRRVVGAIRSATMTDICSRNSHPHSWSPFLTRRPLRLFLQDPWCCERCLAKPVFCVFVLTFLYCKNIRKNLALYYSMFQSI